jgi:hypothetical protein
MEVTSPDLAWANAYIARGPSEAVAAMLLLLEMLKYEPRKNPYSERMWQGYLVSFDTLFEKTLARVRQASTSIRIASYTMIDVPD